MIARDPGAAAGSRCRTNWGDYRATPHIAAELERVGRFLEGLGHQVDYALPAIDYRAGLRGADHLLHQQFRRRDRQHARRTRAGARRRPI